MIDVFLSVSNTGILGKRKYEIHVFFQQESIENDIQKHLPDANNQTSKWKIFLKTNFFLMIHFQDQLRPTLEYTELKEVSWATLYLNWDN